MFKALSLLGAGLFLATFSSSPSYKLQNYNIGSGGTNSASSTTYKLNASTGEVSGSTGSGSTKKNPNSSIQTQQANVPLAPTLDDGGGTYYNQLGFTINMSGDPTDYTYAIAVSTDNFVTTKYVQSDGTLGVNQVYQTYIAWGGAGGSTMTGLAQSTTYKVKVAAKQGLFTNSAFGPPATASTVGPQLSFSMSPSTINLGVLPAGSIVAGGGQIILSTNAASGGNIYVASTNGGLKSTAVNKTIAQFTGNLTSPSEGVGLIVTGFSVLTPVSPYNGPSPSVGAASPTFSLMASGSAPGFGTITYDFRAKASTTTPAAGDYQEVLTFVASASF